MWLAYDIIKGRCFPTCNVWRCFRANKTRFNIFQNGSKNFAPIDQSGRIPPVNREARVRVIEFVQASISHSLSSRRAPLLFTSVLAAGCVCVAQNRDHKNKEKNLKIVLEEKLVQITCQICDLPFSLVHLLAALYSSQTILEWFFFSSYFMFYGGVGCLALIFGWFCRSLWVGINEKIWGKKNKTLCYLLGATGWMASPPHRNKAIPRQFSQNHRFKLKPGVIHHRLGWFSSKECRQVRLIGTLEECFGGAVGCVLLSPTSDHTGCRGCSIGNFRCCICFLCFFFLSWLYAWLVETRVLH